MAFSLKKYRQFAIMYFLISIGVMLLAICMGIGREWSKLSTVHVLKLGVVLGTIGAIPFFVLSIYYLKNYIFFKGRAKKFTPTVGIVCNWEPYLRRIFGRIYVKVEDREYESAAYFSSNTAKSLVGRRIAYAIINEKLFIYEILNN